MNKLFALFIACLFCGFAQAQSPQKNAANYNPNVDSVAEALVLFAMNNPVVKTVENVSKQYEYEYRRARTTWMNHIAVAGNLNEFSLKGNNNPGLDPIRQSTQFPRYNIGVQLPLGIFVNNKKMVRANQYKYFSTIDQVDIEKRSIRKEVLTTYENFKMIRQLLLLQSEVLNDLQLLSKSNEDKFSKQQISVEEFVAASRSYNSEKVKEVTLTYSLKETEARLEQLIGMSIYDALEQIAIRQQQNQ